MLLWYVGVSVVIVLLVFQSAGIDYRLVAVGSLLPLVVDLPLRRLWIGHTLVAGVALLVLVMLVTVGRPRLLRRRLLCLPIGVLCGLALSGAWTNTEVFWWPFTGTNLPEASLLPAPGVVVVEELAGLAAIAWVVFRCALTEPARRDELVHTGRLRTTMGA
jgi:hypothetical protein